MRFWHIAIPALLLCCGLRPEARADAVDDYIKSQMAAQQIPGLALAVVRDGKPIKVKGYGVADVEKATPVTPSTSFEIGSVSKPFTAATVLGLIESGRIGFDDPMSRYFAGVPRQWRAITVLRLLTNSSGIKDYRSEFRGTAGVELTPELIYQKAIGSGLNFPPGTQFRYSHTNYVLLGMIVEAATGRPLFQAVADQIFKPLGMTRTFAAAAQKPIPDAATGYRIAEGIRAPAERETRGFGDAFLSSTLDDLVKWAVALDAGTLLSEQVRTAMWTPAALTPATKAPADSEAKPKTAPYGMGWYVEMLKDHRVIGHGGSVGGFAANLTRFPDDHLTVIILTNLRDVNVFPLIRAVASRYAPALK